MNNELIEKAFENAKAQYKELGIDVDEALEKLDKIPISIHCWQGDDVGGFEKPEASLGGGGIQVTGNFPGKARNIGELRQDLEKVFSLVPGKHRVNLHAIYGEFGGKIVERDQISPENFQGWINWAKKLGVGLDFNPTLFSHPFADDGFTLSSKNAKYREFWIEHCKKSREIAAYMGKELGSAAVCNLWIPDGTKDSPIDRFGYRKLLKESLDKVYETTYPKSQLLDFVEGKLFGIGSESFVVGSHDFYLSYSTQNPNVGLCMDMGHFHPTENVGEKIPAIAPFQDDLLLHVSRGVRWDSDHVVLLNDELMSVANEVVRADALDKTHIALDFFDASINRIGAWVTGIRATQKALLRALLEPTQKLIEVEESGNNFKRMALLEEMKSMPYGAIWDHFCLKKGVAVGTDWIDNIMGYEESTLSKRQ